MDINHKFNIRKEKNEAGNILYLEGELDLSMAERLKAVAEPLAREEGEALTVSLRDLQYMDSTGIGIFVSLLKIREPMQSPFTIVDIPPKIKRLFDITGISKFLPKATN